MTITITAVGVLSLLGSICVGVIVGFIVAVLLSIFDFTLDLWFSYQVMPWLQPMLLVLGGVGGVWLWWVAT